MAKQKIVFTVMPNGIETEAGPMQGRYRVSIVISPRLTPEAAGEQQLSSFPEWLDWPATLQAMKFELQIGGGSVPLVPLAKPQLTPDSAVWQHLFPATLPVAGFVFKDFSKLNLRSFPVRNVMGFVRKHYSNLSLAAGRGEHPTLLPWREADPGLKGMLSELGTKTVKQDFGHSTLEFSLPGFGRFFEDPKRGEGPRPHEAFVDGSVFNKDSCIEAPVRPVPGQAAGRRAARFRLRALPPDWEDPALIRNGTIFVADAADRERRAFLMEKFSGPAEYALWQSDRFYRRTQATKAQKAMRRPSFAGGTLPIKVPEYDFHQRVASYSDHPNLLRRLGLVIDCVLLSNAPLDVLLAGGSPAQGLMRLKVTSGGPHQPGGDIVPRTAWRATKARFTMLPRSDDHADGLLRLAQANDRYLPQVHPKEGSPFDVSQTDPDGAALKTVDFLVSAQGLVARSLALGNDGEVTYTTGDRQPVAALRSGGIGVSRHGRAGEVAMTAASAALNNARIEGSAALAAQLTLYAEDVLRGYRIDVHDMGTGRWRSLLQRQVSCTALPHGAAPDALGIDLPPDEGYVKGASTTGAEDKPEDQYLHETMFRWTGWSLAAPRPGRTLRSKTEPGTQLQTEEVVEPGDVTPAASGSGLVVQVAVAKGTLPRLRFGHRYRLRARLVDLAGNSLALDDADVAEFEQASDAVFYGRFEPLDPPALVLPRKLSEGESLERLVLRSNFDQSTADYSASVNGGALAAFYGNADFEYTATADRHVVPPKAAQLSCEQHGMFDAAIGSQSAALAKAAYAIAARESGSLMKPVPGALIELVTPAKTSQVATVQGAGELIAAPELADATRDRFAAGQYLVHREPIVPVPYLADPAVGGIALHGVPGMLKLIEGKPLQLLAPGLIGVLVEPGLRMALVLPQKQWVLLADFDRYPGDDPGQNLANDWPDDLRSLRLILAEQPGEVETPPCGDEHTHADAPKWDLDAGTLTIFLPKGHIARLRYASFAHDKLVDQLGLPDWHDLQTAQRLRAEAMAGANWMITPWRALTLVHGTQQPVCQPRMEIASASRAIGAQFATLRARHIRLHGPSSGKFEIVGEWHEWIDDPLSGDPKRVHHLAQLSEIRLGENHANVFNLDDAVAKQNEFKPVGGQVTPDALNKRPAVPGNRHEFGDTRFRFIRYRLRATTRFREYLPPLLFADAQRITRDGPVAEVHQVVIDAVPEIGIENDAGAPVRRVPNATTQSVGGMVVPSSVLPTVPEVVYVVPTFRWDRSTGNDGTRYSQRAGNGLRVYLERPWFSSGDGELLGVVIAGHNTGFDAVTAALLPYVTQWGQDPMWDSDIASARSRVTDFAARVADDRVQLLELPSTTVHVIGHRVHFDPKRKLWYSDIELSAGTAYTPFVRLALVRYQPHSLGGQEISRVVLAEFAQLLPRRRASFKRVGTALDVKAYGALPEHGPMRQFNTGGMAESPYADISFQPSPFGGAGELGRNRMELVLQTRPASLDSDLAWEDQAVLVSGEVSEQAASGGASGTGAVGSGGIGAIPVQQVGNVVLRRTRGGQTLRFDRMEASTATAGKAGKARISANLGIAGSVGTIGKVDTQIAPHFFEVPIWSRSATLPAVSNGRVGRLMLREFERFYTDRTVPEKKGNKTHRRIVVEERLVYAEVFDV